MRCSPAILFCECGVTPAASQYIASAAGAEAVAYKTLSIVRGFRRPTDRQILYPASALVGSCKKISSQFPVHMPAGIAISMPGRRPSGFG